MPFKCSFEECNVELVKTEIDAHEKDCKFRLVQCVFLHSCESEKVSLASIKYHIDDCASSLTNIALNKIMPTFMFASHWRDFEIDEECFNNQKHFITCVNAHQHSFYVEIVRTSEGDTAKGLWHFWVYFLGSKKEAQFWSDFTIRNRGDEVI